MYEIAITVTHTHTAPAPRPGARRYAISQIRSCVTCILVYIRLHLLMYFIYRQTKTVMKHHTHKIDP